MLLERQMNNKESIALGLCLVSIFLLVIILFAGVNKTVVLKMESGKSITTSVPRHFSFPVTFLLMVLSAVAAVSFWYYASDYAKKLSRKQHISAKLLEGDVRKMYMFILQKEEVLQKDLIYELGFPKAKVTRILDKLDQKGLVKRISYGKTNKIVAD